MDQDFLIELTGNLYRLTLLFPKKEPLRYKMREKAIDILTKPNEKDLEILDSFFEVALIQKWVSPSEMLAVKTKYDNLMRELESKTEEKEEEGGLFSSHLEVEENEISSSPSEGEENEISSSLSEGEENEISSSPSEAEESKISSSEKKDKIETKPQLEPQLIQKKKASSFVSQKSFNGAGQRQEKIFEFLKENGRAQVWQIKEVMPDITKRTLRRDFEYMLSQGLIKRIGERNDTFYQIKINEA